MAKVKDILRKCVRWTLCGSMIFAADSPTKNNRPKYTAEELAPLKNYSMIEAFKYGLVNSISDYIDQTHYRTDTTVINRATLEQGTSIMARVSLPELPEDILAEYPEAAEEIKEEASSSKAPTFTRGTYNQHNYSTRVIHFVADTISEPNLSPEMKQRIVRLVDNFNDSIERKATLAHEFIHQDRSPSKTQRDKFKKISINVRSKSLHDYIVTPEENMKLYLHDEIGGNIGSLLLLREIYKKTGAISIFSKRFGDYKEAIESGQIKPFSNDPIEKEKERFFIAKYVTGLWEKNNLKNYENGSIRSAYRSAEKGRFKEAAFPGLSTLGISADNPFYNEYNKALDAAYTFIMDGEIVNMNYVSNSQIRDIPQTPKMAAHAKSIRRSAGIEETGKNVRPPYIYNRNTVLR